MKLRRFALLILGAVSLCAAAPADLTLSNGRVLKSARVVAIGKDSVTISHAAGIETTPHDSVPLDVLARAHMELEDKAAERKKTAERLTEQAAKQSAANDAKRQDEIRIRLAMAHAREQAQTVEAVAPSPAPGTSPAARETALSVLKASMPKHPSAHSQDPAIRDCVSKYTRAVAQIRADNIPQNAKYLRDNIARDIAAYQNTLATTDGAIRGSGATKSATGAMRTAARNNATWLESLLVYVEQIERLQ